MEITVSLNSHVSDAVLILHVCDYNQRVVLTPNPFSPGYWGLEPGVLGSNHLV